MNTQKYIFICTMACLLAVTKVFAQEDAQFFDLSLEELMHTKVSSVSNYQEDLKDAPASVIVITKDEIKDRAYGDLLEIFQDLPGIDLSATYGDLFYKAHWRGYRKSGESAFLLMQDGMVLNNLWFGFTDILVAMPLSNIERIEIVYGPSSSIYGANAMMGVVNIITNKKTAKEGTTVNSRIAGGAYGRRIADLNVLYKKDKWKLAFAGSINDGSLDTKSTEAYEWTKSKYYKSKELWGDFLDQVQTDLQSPYKNRSASLQLSYDKSEIGVQIYNMETGIGLNLPHDRIHPSYRWKVCDINLYGSHRAQLNEEVLSTSNISYRESNVPGSPISLEQRNKSGEERKIAVGIWDCENHAITLQQDFDVNFHENFHLKTGVVFQRKDIQKKYNSKYGSSIFPGKIEDYELPELTADYRAIQNRTIWEEQGIYVQSKYKLSSALQFLNPSFVHVGIRVDDHSTYGTNTTLRVAYTSNYNNFGYKFLYGEALQVPAPRQLYGHWDGASSNSKLQPEKSRNVEAVFSWMSPETNIILNPFYVYIDKTISYIKKVPQNIGERENFGIDIQIKRHFKISKHMGVENSIYFTYIHTSEKKFPETKPTYYDEIGDIAPFKIKLINTIRFNENLSATLRHRYFSKQNLIESNPVGNLDAYYICDLSLVWKDFWKQGFGVSLKVINLFDKQYYHAGIREADAGTEQGSWNGKVWTGSRSWQNSLLPQPRRSLILSMFFSM